MTVFSWPVSSALSDEQEQMSAADMMKDVVRMIVFILQILNTQTAEKQRKPLFGRLSRRFSGDLLGVRRADVCQAVNHRRGRFGGFCILGSDPSGVFKPSFCTF